MRPASHFLQRLALGIALLLFSLECTSRADTLVTWGDNKQGQLGDGNNPAQVLPKVVEFEGLLPGEQIVQLAAGFYHSMALTSQGRLYAWGENAYGELGLGNRVARTRPVLVQMGPLAGKTIVELHAGVWTSWVLTSDGKVFGWGDSTYGQLGVFEESVPLPRQITSGLLAEKSVKRMTTGYRHVLAETTEGELIAWGYNRNGQLGDGSSSDSAVPVLVSTPWAASGATVVQLAAGAYHTMVVLGDGTAYSWGSSASGALGRSGPATLPGQVDPSGALAGKKIIKADSGYSFSVVLADDGRLYGWGANDGRQIGEVTSGSTSLPVAINMTGMRGLAVADFVCSRNHTAILAQNGVLFGLGSSFNFWPHADGYIRTTPETSTMFELMACGERLGRSFNGLVRSRAQLTMLGLMTDGTVLAWGTNSTGQAGTGQEFFRADPRHLMPVNPEEVTPLLAASAYGAVMLAMQPPQWGNVSDEWDQELKSFGEVGGSYPFSFATFRYDFQVSTIPKSYTQVDAELDFDQIVAGNGFFLFKTLSGEVYGCGDDFYDQLLRLGNTSSGLKRLSDVEPLATTQVEQIAAGQFHAMALGANGRLYAWGRNSNGQIGNGDTGSSVLVPFWVNQTGVLAGQEIVSIAAGGDYSLVLTGDGRLYGWGANGSGQLGDGTSTDKNVPVAHSMSGALQGKKVIKIAGGLNHVIALTEDGLLVGWGSNKRGQLGSGVYSPVELIPVPVVQSGVLAGEEIDKILCGNECTLLLTKTGKILGMGNNAEGVLANDDAKDRSEPVLVSQGQAFSGRKIKDVVLGTVSRFALALVEPVVPAIKYRAEKVSYPWDISVENGLLRLEFDINSENSSRIVRVFADGTAPLSQVTFALEGTAADRFSLVTRQVAATDGLPAHYEAQVRSTGPADVNVRRAILRLTTLDPASPSVEIPLTAKDSQICTVSVPPELERPLGQGLSLTPSITGNPVSFQWFKDGLYLPGVTGRDLVIDNLAPSDAGKYRLRIVYARGNLTSTFGFDEHQWVWSSEVDLKLKLVPTFNTHPQPQSVVPGATAVYSVDAVNNAPASAMTYQWRKDGNPLPGATGPELRLTEVTPEAEGAYDVVVTNAEGSSTSRSATLTLMLGAPIFVAEPACLLGVAGRALMLPARAYGQSPMQYAWYKGAAQIRGAVQSELHFPSLKPADAAAYRVVVGNTQGTKVQGRSISLGVITQPPGALAVAERGALVMTCKAVAPAGAKLSYLWKLAGTAISDGASYKGSQTQTLRILSAGLAQAGEYSCEVTLSTQAGAATADVGPTQVNVVRKPVLHPVNLPELRVGQMAGHVFGADHGAIKFTATGLPPGLLLNSSTGQVSGRPTLEKKGAGGAVVPYLVRVTASNLAGPGEPLVVPWLVQPLPAEALGTFEGLIAREALLNGAVGRSEGLGGTFKLVTTSTGAFTGSLTLAGTLLPFKGTVEVTPGLPVVAAVQVPRKAPLSPLQLNLAFSGDGLLAGTLKAGVVTATLEAVRPQASEARKGVSISALSLPGPAPQSVPEGAGFATVAVDAKGKASWTVRLADGVAATFTSSVGHTGRSPFHALLYKGTGSLQGWSILQDGGSLGGTWDWNKYPQPASSTRSYVDGIPLHQRMLDGARYVRSGSAEMPTGFANTGDNAYLLFLNGGLEVPLGQVVSWRATGAIQAAQEPLGLKAGFSPATATFTGSFIVPGAGGRKADFQGVLLPHLQQGLGYFLLPAAVAPGQTPSTAPVLSGEFRVVTP